MSLRVGSLFAGIGGFDLGFERAGHQTVWQVEIDAKCREALARHFPNARRHEDVRAVGRADLDPVDLICGGFPCQDLSVAGRRAGLAGERSGLWSEFHRILAELAPRWCAIENVPGLFSSNEGRDFATVLDGLVELGYRVAWRVLDAQFADLAQRRERVFIVGSLGDGGSAEVLFEPESVRWNPPPRREARAGAPFASLSGLGSGGPDDNDGQANRIVASPVTASNGHHGHSSPRGDGADNLVPAVAFTLNASPRGTGPNSGQGWNSTFVPEIVPQAMSSKWSKGSSGPAGDEHHNLIASTLRSRNHAPGVNAPGRGGEDDMNLIAFDTTQITNSANRSNPQAGDPCHPILANSHAPAIAETLSSNSRNRSATPGPIVPALQSGTPTYERGDGSLFCAVAAFGVRRLTPVECARLQGFPDDWLEGFSDSACYKMLGNAVPPPIVERLGRRLATRETTKGETP